MHYFITGATGLLGQSLISKIKNNHQITTCLIHQQKFSLTNKDKIKIIKGDLSDYKLLVSSLTDIDIIIHCAAAINPKKKSDYYKVNYQGTKNLVKAAKKNNIKLFVYISSWAVNPEGGDYANSKFLAEKEVKKFPNYLIIRPSDIYSKTQSHLLGLIKLIKSLPVIPIVGNGEYKVSPLFVEDLITAIFYLINQKKWNSTYTILGPKVYTFKEIVETILKELKINKTIIYLPHFLIYPAIYLGDKLHFSLPLNIEKYKRLTTKKKIENVFDFEKSGFSPLSFEKALKYLINL